MAWTVEFKEDGRFSISGDSPGYEPDAAYERQQMITSYLGGRVLALYFDSEEPLTNAHEALMALGFDATAVVLGSTELGELKRNVHEQSLWAIPSTSEATEGGLLATPLGFHRWTDIVSLARVLPSIEEVEFNPPSDR
jgi:hypothetical protein